MERSDRAPAQTQDIPRALGVSISAGVISGALVGGVGGRIVMRISAIAADSDGLITEGGNRVGDITIGGTIALIVFGGILSGVLGGLLLFVLHPWLPEHPASRSVVLAVVLPLIAAAAVIAPENSDFLILDPPELNVALFFSLFVAFGPVATFAATIVDRHVPVTQTPAGGQSEPVVTAAIVLAPAALLALVLFADELPLVSLCILLIGLATVLGHFAAAVAPPHRRLRRTAPVLGYGALIGASMAGASYLAQGIADIQ